MVAAYQLPRKLFESTARMSFYNVTFTQLSSRKHLLISLHTCIDIEEVICETTGFHQSSGLCVCLILSLSPFLSLCLLSLSMPGCLLYHLAAVSLFAYSVYAQPLRHFLVMPYNKSPTMTKRFTDSSIFISFPPKSNYSHYHSQFPLEYPLFFTLCLLCYGSRI